MFLTLNGQNSVAITLINVKLYVNIVVGSALSLVTQRKNYNAPIGGTTAMLYNLHCYIGDLGGTAEGVSPSFTKGGGHSCKMLVSVFDMPCDLT